MYIDAIILLALTSLLIFFIPVGWKVWVAAAIVALGGAASVYTAVAVFLKGPVTYTVDSLAVLGDTVAVIDSVSAIFLIMISVASLSAVIYSAGYLRDDFTRKAPLHISAHYLSYVMLFLSMLCVVIFRSAFAFLLSWEMMTLSSFVLVMYEAGKKKVMRTAISYLTVMHAGFFFLLAAFVKLSSYGLPDNFDSLTIYFSSHNPLPLFLLFFVGFGLKAGVFPLHTWLPETHPAAPSHVSALMSGVMIKMGVYGVLRVTSHIGEGLYTIAIIILICGMVTALWGVIYAAIQDNLKRLLAYSSIENIGIIMIAIGAGLLGTATGNSTLAAYCITGALLHTLFHSFFKPLLFMGAGSVIHATGMTSMNRYGGLMKRMPVTGLLFLVGCVAIAALPPMNGFVSEFMIYSGLIDAVALDGSTAVIAVITVFVLSLVGGLAIVVFSKAFGITFLGVARSCAAGEAKEADTAMIVGQTIPLAAILLSAFVPMPFVATAMSAVEGNFNIGEYQTISPASDTFSDIVMVFTALCVVVAALYLLRKALQSKREVTSGPTWGCGYGNITKKMQYTGESFTQPLRELGPMSSRNAPPPLDIFPQEAKFTTDSSDRINTIVQRRWIMVIRKLTSRMALFQTGHINHYILHALLFILAIFVLTFINVI